MALFIFSFFTESELSLRPLEDRQGGMRPDTVYKTGYVGIVNMAFSLSFTTSELHTRLLEGMKGEGGGGSRAAGVSTNATLWSERHLSKKKLQKRMY